jgi:hypothetical protein
VRFITWEKTREAVREEDMPEVTKRSVRSSGREKRSMAHLDVSIAWDSLWSGDKLWGRWCRWSLMTDAPYVSEEKYGEHNGRGRFRHANSLPHFALGRPGKRRGGDWGEGPEDILVNVGGAKFEEQMRFRLICIPCKAAATRARARTISNAGVANSRCGRACRSILSLFTTNFIKPEEWYEGRINMLCNCAFG